MRRASSRCRSTAGPAPTSGAPDRCTSPPGARDCFRRVVGAWGNEDLIENAFKLREYDPARGAARGPAARSASSAVPHFVATNAVEITRRDGGGRFTYGADSSPIEELCTFAREHRPAADRGHAAATRARRPARPPDAGRGRRARAPRRSAPAGSRISPTSSMRAGRRPRPSASSAARSRSRARAPSTRSEAAAVAPTGRCNRATCRAARALGPRPVRQLRAHAARDGRAVRRRVRRRRRRPAAAARSRPPSTSTTPPTRRARSCAPSSPASRAGDRARDPRPRADHRRPPAPAGRRRGAPLPAARDPARAVPARRRARRRRRRGRRQGDATRTGC